LESTEQFQVRRPGRRDRQASASLPLVLVGKRHEKSPFNGGFEVSVCSLSFSLLVEVTEPSRRKPQGGRRWLSWSKQSDKVQRLLDFLPGQKGTLGGVESPERADELARWES
jgi:hypothetical protein